MNSDVQIWTIVKLCSFFQAILNLGENLFCVYSFSSILTKKLTQSDTVQLPKAHVRTSEELLFETGPSKGDHLHSSPSTLHQASQQKK